MITVHTSMINSTLNYEAVARRFDFIAIELKDISHETTSERLQELLTKLYRLKNNNFLAVAKESNQRYIALIAKKQDYGFNENDVAIRALSENALPPDWLILTLLTNALPTQLASNSKRQAPWFFASNLHYVVGHKSYKNGFHEIICCKVRPVPCQGISGQHLQPSTTTFSPREAHFFRDALTRRARKQPSFDLDNASQTLANKGAGAYLNIPIFKSAKARAPAYEVSAKAPENFQRSRLGALTIFLNDFNQAYDGMAKIELKMLEAEQTKLKEKDIDGGYQKLLALLAKQTITLINSSDESTAATTLTSKLEQRGFKVVADAKPTNGLILHIVKSKGYYKTNELLDPYLQLREQYPHAVIQSCTDESIQRDNKHVTDVLLTELLVKSEIAQGRLIADYPSLPPELIFMAARKHPDKENKTFIWFCAQVIDRQLKLWLATQDEINMAFSCSTSAQLKRLHNSYRMPYVIYDSKLEQLMLLQDTQAISIPDYEALASLLKTIGQSRQKTVPAALVYQFLNEHPLGQELSTKLKPLLEQSLHGQLEAEDVAKVHHKSKAEIAFHEHLAQHGHLLNTSLRGKDGPLGSVRDIWSVPGQGLYCTGPKGSPKQITENFSHIYHLDNLAEGFPEWFIPSLQVWHVRHRNATTIPFVFKHLNEFQRQQLPQSNEEDDDG